MHEGRVLVVYFFHWIQGVGPVKTSRLSWNCHEQTATRLNPGWYLVRFWGLRELIGCCYGFPPPSVWVRLDVSREETGLLVNNTRRNTKNKQTASTVRQSSADTPRSVQSKSKSFPFNPSWTRSVLNWFLLFLNYNLPSKLQLLLTTSWWSRAFSGAINGQPCIRTWKYAGMICPSKKGTHSWWQ